MPGIIEPVEIILDKPRLLKVNHRALRIAESELNRMRRATPVTTCSIDFAIVISYNTGIYPRDLQTALLLGFLSTDNPNLTAEQVDAILDKTEAPAREINDKLWQAYSAVAGKNLKQDDGSITEKKTIGADQPTGSDSGASDVSNLN